MVRIEEIKGRKQLTKFVKFAIDLYKGNDCYVPPIISGEVDNLDETKNPAFKFCDAIFYMAYNEKNKCVGRIAGIINPRYNSKSGEKLCRFGFVDFIDDYEVSKALFDAVSEWGKAKGMTSFAGPMGFTDLDYEGALTEGFDKLSTISTIYNYPYYQQHYEKYGMMMDAKWNEFEIKVPATISERHQQIASFVIQHYNLRSFYVKDPKELVAKYGKKIFELLNIAYSPLYCVSELDDDQINYYISTYIPQLKMECLRLVTDSEDNLIAFAITCPSLARAQQKAKGHMWPFGWIHLAKAMYMKGGTEGWDLMLIAVRPDYQGKGVNSLLIHDLLKVGIKNGYKWVAAYPELDYNFKVQSQWKYFDSEVSKKRATFRCEIA